MNANKKLLGHITLDELVLKDPLWSKILPFIKDRSADTYLVGGYLRDLLIGKASLDIDLLTEEDSLSYAQALALSLKGSSFLMDEVHLISRVVLKDEGRAIDISTYQDEIVSDLKRRDFTIDSLALDLGKFIQRREAYFPADLIDTVGGWDDLVNSLVRITIPSSFKEDPVRLLRALRILGTLGFKLEEETAKAIKTDSNLIKKAAPERQSSELFYIFALPESSSILQLADKLGLLKVILEEVEDLKGVSQNGYHHLDVWNHSLLTVKIIESIASQLSSYFNSYQEEMTNYLQEEIQERIARLSILKFSALLHDLGKPKSRFTDEKGRIRFFGHPKLSAEIAENICKRLKLSRKLCKILTLTIKEHMRPGFLVHSFTERAEYRFLRDLGEEAAGTCLLSLADRMAAQGPLSDRQALESHKELVSDLVSEFFRKRKEPVKKRKLLTGNDLIEEFGLKPGPKIGKLLAELEEAEVMGNIKDKKSALKFMSELIKKNQD